MECQQVASYLQHLNDTSNRTGLSMGDVGVITPYHKSVTNHRYRDRLPRHCRRSVT